MMKTGLLGVALSLCSLAAWAQSKEDKNWVAPAGPATVLTLVDGGVSVTVDSFGRAGHAMPGCGAIGSPGGFMVDEGASVLCNHSDFFSTGGMVLNINPTNCMVVSPITVDPLDATHATSTVSCGACTFGFDQKVTDALKNWTTSVTVSGSDCTLGCYYSYNDYDVHGFADNGGSFQSNVAPPPLGQFVVRNNGIMPGVHYLFTDQSTATHWIQDSYPTVLSGLMGLSSCVDLSDSPAIFTSGDWTGAIQYPAASTLVSYSLGRDDTTTFP